MRWLDLLYGAAFLAYLPRALYRRVFFGRYKDGWRQRLGYIQRKEPHKPCIWLHTVSVGETNAARTLIDSLRQTYPDIPIAVSATTDAGYQRAQTLYGAFADVFYFPFDLSWVMARAIERINPALICLMELEVWPHLVALAEQRGVPVVVVNGRISDRGFRRYRLAGRLVAPTFRRLTLVLAQTDQYAQRFVALGCPADKVRVVGSLKYDTAQMQIDPTAASRLAAMVNLAGEPLVVFGGTGDGEEAIALEVFQRLRNVPALASVRLAIAPRKPERFDAVAQQIQQAGFACLRYSRIKQSSQPVDGKPPVILVDTIGDLKTFYALASVVFVGRSLVPLGGSDMMESAALGKCTLFGPHTFNFQQTVEALLSAGGAIHVADKQQLYEQLYRCLTEPAYREAVAAAGKAVIAAHQGATCRTLDALRPLLTQKNSVV